MEEKPVKIIIAGDGKVGNMLTNQLSAEGHDITLVDSNPEVLEASIENYDVMTVQGQLCIHGGTQSGWYSGDRSSDCGNQCR